MDEATGAGVFAFDCHTPGGADCAYTTLYEEAPGTWQMGLYTLGHCESEQLQQLLERTLEQARELGGKRLRTIVELEAHEPLQLFRRAGLPLSLIFCRGGESEAEFDLGRFTPESVNPG